MNVLVWIGSLSGILKKSKKKKFYGLYVDKISCGMGLHEREVQLHKTLEVALGLRNLGFTLLDHIYNKTLIGRLTRLGFIEEMHMDVCDVVQSERL